MSTPAPKAGTGGRIPARPTTVGVLSTEEADRHALEVALSEAGISAACTCLQSLEAVRSAHGRDGIDLVVLWTARSPVPGETLREALDRLVPAPPLLIAVDRFTPQAYVRAGTLRAEDVITTEWLGQFELAVKRTLHTQALRHRLDAVREQLAGSRIVDRSDYAEAPPPDAIPPLVEVIDEALRTDGLHLVFQPIVAVEADDVDSYEVFVRLRHEGRDMLPEEFLPQAARYGLLPALDRWVVRNAVRRFTDEKQSRHRHSAGPRFFLNVSAHTLVEEHAAETLLKIIARARPTAGEFVIKLDKNTLLSRLAPAKTLNRLVKKVGLQFALDHYEHSDNRLNFLEHIAIDYIKLHGSLTHGIDQDPGKRRNVLEVLTTARRNGIRVIAGQVERPTELAALYGLGVDYVQGFQVAPPDGQVGHPVPGAIEQ